MEVSACASKGLWEGHVTDANLGFITSPRMAAHVSNPRQLWQNSTIKGSQLFAYIVFWDRNLALALLLDHSERFYIKHDE